MHFRLFPLRLGFEAVDAIRFPPGKAGNVLRGALGGTLRELACEASCTGPRDCQHALSCAYARLFEPHALTAGPSGLKDWPRPFVFRAGHLDGLQVKPGTRFHFDVNFFLDDQKAAECLIQAFRVFAQRGFGPLRGRAVPEEILLDPWEPLLLDLRPVRRVGQVRVEFLTPTELKSSGERVTQPEFHVLFARARDRVATLCALYGAGPLPVDFKAMGASARSIRLVRCETSHQEVLRRSSRSGQVHPIGGFTGLAEYEGDVTQFLPFLEAAQWCGVGSRTVWGNGHIRVITPA